MHPKWKGLMEGVCGDYDNDQSNDMMSAGGILQTNVTDFVKSWQLSQACQPSGPLIVENDPCLGRREREPWAKTSCEVVRTAAEGNPFSACIERVAASDVSRSYMECLYDACNCDRGGDCECLCSSLAAFGELCIQAGVPVRCVSVFYHHADIQCQYLRTFLSNIIRYYLILPNII